MVVPHLSLWPLPLGSEAYLLLSRCYTLHFSGRNRQDARDITNSNKLKAVLGGGEATGRPRQVEGWEAGAGPLARMGRVTSWRGRGWTQAWRMGKTA